MPVVIWVTVILLGIASISNAVTAGAKDEPSRLVGVVIDIGLLIWLLVVFL